MRLLRPASEDDMVATFLAAEVASERYGPQIRQILARLGQPLSLAEAPDTRDQAANAVRRQVLATYRDYPAGDVFTGMPADVRWHHAALTPAELAAVRYIDYPYWTDFSGGTRLAADGARRLGPWQRMPPRTIYRQIAENLRDGKLPPPSSCSANPARRTWSSSKATSGSPGCCCARSGFPPNWSCCSASPPATGSSRARTSRGGAPAGHCFDDDGNIAQHYRMS
jgi:hypothetical protein